MKKLIFFLLTLVLTTTVSQKITASPSGHSQLASASLAQEGVASITNSDSPITKTVEIEDPESKPGNMWITLSLALFGIVLLFVFKRLRKKKSQAKK